MYGRGSPMTESFTTSVDSSATSQAGTGGDRRQPPAVEGRGGKANRRRSRASRKAPTTVLNTDTTNFRALVQHYTGGPSTAPFQAAYPLTADGVGGSGSDATFGYGLAAGSTAQQLHHQPAGFPAALGVQQQYQQYAQFQQHHERALFMPGASGTAGGGDVYFRGFGSSNLQRDITDAPDVFLLERLSSSQMMPPPAASAGDTASDGFLL